jgi:hypothetical protein
MPSRSARLVSVFQLREKVGCVTRKAGAMDLQIQIHVSKRADCLGPEMIQMRLQKRLQLRVCWLRMSGKIVAEKLPFLP